MLKITAPFREKKEVIPLIKAGADELYCGYLCSEWIREYTGFEFERKGGSGSNFTDLEELKKAVSLSHQRGVPVYLSLNGLYVDKQYPLLLKIIDQLEKIDMDGYIIADIGLLLTLRKKGLRKQIHISTGGTVFNSQGVDFYKSLGASRIILDRQTTLKSIKKLSEKHPDMDFEVFILNTLCVYIDGFCTFVHTCGRESLEDLSKKNWKKDEKMYISTAFDPEAQADACSLRYSVEALDADSGKKIKPDKAKPMFYKQMVDGKECGACALYDIINTGVKSVKIVGRQMIPEERLQDTGFIRACLGILKNDTDIKRQDFIYKVQGLYRKTYKYKGRCKGNNCYHPEVLNTRCLP